MYENELTHAWYLGTRQLMLSQIKNSINKKSKILDAGCGTGGTIVYLRKNGYKNVFGIDSSKFAINYNKKRKIKNVSLASIDKIPFKNNSFDAVICMDVLYHKDVDPKSAVEEIFRVLKNGGIFYSQEPAYDWLKSGHDRIIETKKRFKRKELVDVISTSGLENIKNSHFNTILFLPIAISRFKNRIHERGDSGSDVDKLPALLNLLMLFSLNLEAKILKFTNLPFGLSIVSLWRK